MLPTFDVPRGAIALGEMLEHSSSPDWRRSGLIAQTLGAVALGRLERLHDLTRRLAEVAPETELELFNAELPAALAYVDPGSIPTIGALDDLSSWIASSGVDPLRDRAVWMSTLLGRRTPARPGARGEFELFIVADSWPPPATRARRSCCSIRSTSTASPAAWIRSFAPSYTSSAPRGVARSVTSNAREASCCGTSIWTSWVCRPAFPRRRRSAVRSVPR